MNDQPQLRAVDTNVPNPNNNNDKVQWKQIGTVTIFTAALTALVTWTITYFLERARKKREQEQAQAQAQAQNPSVRGGTVSWPGVEQPQEMAPWEEELQRFQKQIEGRMRNLEDLRERVEDVESHQFRRLGRRPMVVGGQDYDDDE